MKTINLIYLFCRYLYSDTKVILAKGKEKFYMEIYLDERSEKRQDVKCWLYNSVLFAADSRSLLDYLRLSSSITHFWLFGWVPKGF